MSNTLTHASIWQAIDQLAANNGLSTSGLARKAGLDPTSFNTSKRTVPSTGYERWPNMQSIAKCLAATGVPLKDFVSLIEEAP